MVFKFTRCENLFTEGNAVAIEPLDKSLVCSFTFKALQTMSTSSPLASELNGEAPLCRHSLLVPPIPLDKLDNK